MKLISVFLLFILSIIGSNVLAACPVCAVAVGTGIGMAQYIGVDDVISGIWIGGLIVSLIAWTIKWLDDKNIHFYGRKILITAFYYASTIVPLHLQKITGHELNKLWGFDKILLGMFFGSLVFFISILFCNYLRQHNNNKSYFVFQKITTTVLALIILSVIFYYITK